MNNLVQVRSNPALHPTLTSCAGRSAEFKR